MYPLWVLGVVNAGQTVAIEGDVSGGYPAWMFDVLYVLLAIFLVALNGFFVAAEFALVKVRGSQVEELVRQRKPCSGTALWLASRMEDSLSVCQLGITMASLALGWVGEPAFSRLIEPLLHGAGIQSETVVRTIGFALSFTFITGLHLVIGEQAPKIFAIRRPEQMILWCAVPMKFFFVMTYPLMISLNGVTSMILKRLGVDGTGHEAPHSEEEIRALLREARIHGDVTHSEQRLIDAVFEFDDMICRRVMVPRADVEFFTFDQSLTSCLTQASRSRHTRFPLCDGSLDHVVGVVHIKNLIGQKDDGNFNLKSVARPPKTVPENMPISKLLRHFQGTRQHMAFVVDEYSTTIGIVTLENVLEQIVGPVQDEFDLETPEIVPDGPGQYIVQGSTAIEVVEKVLNLEHWDDDVDTFSGLLMSRHGEILEAGDRIDLNGAVAEVLEVKGARAERIRVTLNSSPAAKDADSND
ncbi:MAG: hemolysin family protein [Planctomycetaceae bacterium]